MKRGALHGIKAAIFDLDGTLFDSTHIWAQIDIDFLRIRGLSPTDEYKRHIAALGAREGAVFTVRYYGLSDTPEQLMKEWADMARHEYETHIRLFDGVKDYLERTAARGIPLYVVTSLSRELAEPCLKNNGALGLFSDIFTADETGLNKAGPDMFTYAAERAGVDPGRCVVFDDVAAAIRSARRAGMLTVAVRGSGSYNDYTHIDEADADCIVTRLADAPELFPD